MQGAAKAEMPMELAERKADTLKAHGKLDTDMAVQDFVNYHGNLTEWFSVASHNERVLRLAYWIYREDHTRRKTGYEPPFMIFAAKAYQEEGDPWMSIAEDVISEYESGQSLNPEKQD